MMYSNAKTPSRGKTPGTAKKSAPKRPAPRPPTSGATDPVEVFCRVRPLKNREDPVCVKVISPESVILTATENSHAARTGGILKETKYSFKQVFDDCCPQKAVFEQVALPLVEDVLHGQNGLLFAYGITSSGKTHTMMGDSKDPGLLPRSLDVIFNSIRDLQAQKYVFKPDKMNGFDVQTEADAMLERQQRELMPKLNNMCTPKSREDNSHDNSNSRRKDRSRVEDLEIDNTFTVFLSYVEIYNKYIYDLLEEAEYDPITLYKEPKSKPLREDNNHQMYVNGVIEVEVKSTEEAYEVLEKGQRRRRVAHTNLNDESSRSHSVLNIRIIQTPLDELGGEAMQDRDNMVISQLSMVDLAGSERAARTGNQGDRIREAGNINNALMHLRSCIKVLRENQRGGDPKFVPYRYDPMTRLFKTYFEGEGKIRMIVCVNPKAIEYDETVNVMKFAMVTQEVQVTRSEKKEFDIGLPAGRRYQRDQLREEAERVKAERAIVPSIGALPTSSVIYSFSPFPTLQLLHYDDDCMLPELARHLQDRMKQRVRLMNDYANQESSFRAQLVELEQQHDAYKLRNQELKSAVKNKDSEIVRLEKKITKMERAYDTMNRKNTSLERVKNTLEREVGDRDFQIQMASTERTKIEQENKHRINWLEKNYMKKVEIAKSKASEVTAAKLKSQEKKITRARNLLDSDGDSIASSNFVAPMVTRSGHTMARSETDLTSVGRTPVPTPRNMQHHRGTTTAYLPVTRQTAARSMRGMPPPPTKPKPSIKLHRRSKSSHEVCLDHNPTGAFDPKSSLTPNFKKARSVTKLETKDMQGMDKYMIRTMEVDSDGGLATKFYKDCLNTSTTKGNVHFEGDVLRTSTGGNAVVLNDLEVVRHKSPGDRKRKSDEIPSEYADGDEILDRCRIAVQGHDVNKMNMNKRVRQTQL